MLPVLGERDAEAVEDAAARRRQQPQIDAVLLGQDRVPVVLQDLQLVHPRRQRGGEQRLAAGQQRGAAGQSLVAVGLAGHGGGRLSASRITPAAPISARWVRPSAKLATGNIAMVSARAKHRGPQVEQVQLQHAMQHPEPEHRGAGKQREAAPDKREGAG